MLFPEPAIRVGNRHESGSEGEDSEDVRFPWTQRREPSDIQASNMLPLKNHVDVPS